MYRRIFIVFLILSFSLTIANAENWPLVNDRGIVWCLDARTGSEIYGQQRIKPGTYSSSLVLADGKIYTTNEDGLTTVVKAGPKFEVLAENALNDYCLSSPAISDGQIFIRTAQNLYCIGKRKPQRSDPDTIGL